MTSKGIVSFFWVLRQTYYHAFGYGSQTCSFCRRFLVGLTLVFSRTVMHGYHAPQSGFLHTAHGVMASSKACTQGLRLRSSAKWCVGYDHFCVLAACYAMVFFYEHTLCVLLGNVHDMDKLMSSKTETKIEMRLSHESFNATLDPGPS